MTHCDECDAAYSRDGDSCATRFEALLALDHSRREPWGSRHGRAFAAYALQHPLAHAASLDAAWAMLHRIYVDGEASAHVVDAMRAHGGRSPAWWHTPRRPRERTQLPSITIADLDDFDAATYPDRLDDWCRAALASWGADPRGRAMHVKRIAAQLRTTDLQASIRFYTATFGFELDFQYEDFYAGIRAGDQIFHLKLDDEIDASIAIVDEGDHFHLYFDVDDVSAYAGRARSGGATIVRDVHETPWGTRELVVRDDQGHTLYFGERL